MNPETRALIVSLLEVHSISDVHGMMRRNPTTEPVEHREIRSIRRGMLRAGADHQKRGVGRAMSAETRAVIAAMLAKCSPVEAFHTLVKTITGGPEITLGQVKEVRRDMLKAGAPRIAKRGPMRRYTEEELAERRRSQQRHQARAKRAAIADFNVSQTEANRRLVEATEAMFARKAKRLNSSIAAARLVTLYSPTQIQRMAEAA